MEQTIRDAVYTLYQQTPPVELTRPEPTFGDFATNVALKLAKPLGKKPREIAEEVAAVLRQTGQFSEVSVAGPGFINLCLSDEALWQAANTAPQQIYGGMRYTLEYSCPNAFKELHTGHLYQTVYGDILARIIESVGASVDRASFGGDVGLHVAKCLWGMRHTLGGELPEKLTEVESDVFARARWISQAYVIGAKAYEENETAKQEIIELNKLVYSYHEHDEHNTPLAQIYWMTRQWSLDYFDAFYTMIQVDHLDYIPESSTAPIGLAVVHEQLERGNLQRSEGAVVFIGDPAKHLHTRVFVTSNGLPTYETKDIGVIWKEVADYHFDHRILITGNDQKEYMRVVYAAAELFRPELAGRMTHLTNGTVRFGDGSKMSSRLGNVARAADVLAIVQERVARLTTDPVVQRQVALGAIKYAFAKYRMGNDIAFDMDETVSLQGNSGPYIQYAHARACSILAKASAEPVEPTDCTDDERLLLRKLSEYPEVVEKAAREYLVHGICHYLYELAQEFNRFYEKNRVVGSPRQAERLSLVQRYRDTLAAGLALLGIEAPERL